MRKGMMQKNKAKGAKTQRIELRVIETPRAVALRRRAQLNLAR